MVVSIINNDPITLDTNTDIRVDLYDSDTNHWLLYLYIIGFSFEQLIKGELLILLLLDFNLKANILSNPSSNSWISTPHLVNATGQNTMYGLWKLPTKLRQGQQS